MMKNLIDEMVSRFLCWKLPKDFAPDCGISFKLSKAHVVLDVWPTGTNLFHAGQAQEMFRHCLPPTWHPMAAAPRVVRLTDEEVASLLADSDKNSLRVPSFFMVEPHKFARAIETAVFAKNGIEVVE